MQCAYINYLVKKNGVSYGRLEEITGLSPATISRIRTGQREMNPDEFSRFIAACGGDDASYQAFVASLQGAPAIKADESVTLASVRKFYQEQMDDIEQRLLDEMHRLKEHHRLEREKAQQLHARSMDRMEKLHIERIAELKEDLSAARKERDAANHALKAMQEKCDKIKDSRSRWRVACCALLAMVATQWLLDWLVFKEVGFIITAFRERMDSSFHPLRG